MVRKNKTSGMKKSEIYEQSWRKAAEYLEVNISDKESGVPHGTAEWFILQHTKNVVIPSIVRRADIIRRNRKER
jgi:hypothetical protein